MSKKEPRILTQVEHEILAGLHCLSSCESEAMKGYEDFEAKYGMYLKKSELAAIREHISEEKKHLKKLTKMIQKRDGIIPEEEHKEPPVEPEPEPVVKIARRVEKP